MKPAQLLYLIIGGCVLAIIGSCLPWVTVTVMGETRVTSGLDGDGVITLILAIGALVLAVLKGVGNPKVMTIIGASLAGLAAMIGVYDLINIKDKTSELSGLIGDQGNDIFGFSIGIGLYLVIVGSIVALVGFILRLQKTAGPPPMTN